MIIPSFVAEVASTVNESLLLSYLLENESDKTSKMYILNKFIEEFRATVFRQTMFAEFENWTHKYVEEGGSLTAERLCEEYEKLNSMYFGDAYQRMTTSNTNGLESLTSTAPSMYISMLQDFQLQQLFQRKFLKKAKKQLRIIDAS